MTDNTANMKKACLLLGYLENKEEDQGNNGLDEESIAKLEFHMPRRRSCSAYTLKLVVEDGLLVS